MAIRTVVTRGYGSGGTASLVVTRGYIAGVAAPSAMKDKYIGFILNISKLMNR